MILLILSFILLICGLIFFYQANQIKINKNEQQEQYRNQLKEEIHNLQIDKNNLINSEIKKKEQLNKELLQFQEFRKKELNDNLQKQKQIIKLNLEKIKKQTSSEIKNIHEDLIKIKQSALQEKKQINDEIKKMQASLSAGVQARLREQQKKDKTNFYKLSIDETDFSDIVKLENLKSSLHKPVILSKLIWTQYFQKQVTELCDRVFGKEPICGIYKITDLVTEQCYIGQSVNIQQRIKQHCKCGLGIEASATNKLYNTMQRDKIWNFTFELLEKCPKELLNEKEKFWIQMYQSNKFGLNVTKGNK